MKQSEIPGAPELLKYGIYGRMIEFKRPVVELSNAQIRELFTSLDIHHNQGPGWQAFEDWRDL